MAARFEACTLLRVRAALKVKTENWGEKEDDARQELYVIGVGMSATAAAQLQLVFAAASVARWLACIPLLFLLLNLLGGGVLLAVAARRYARYMAVPKRVWRHPYASLLAHPRWPLWCAIVKVEDQAQALIFYAMCTPKIHRVMAINLLAAAQVDLRMAYSAYDEQEVLVTVALLERDARAMEAFRTASVL